MENEEVEMVEYHSIASVEGLPEGLKSVLGDSRIKTIEQAVGFLSVVDINVEGKDEFLGRAKEILGEKAFLKYSTPVKEPPLGCKAPEPEVEIVTGVPSPEIAAEAPQTKPNDDLNESKEG